MFKSHFAEKLLLKVIDDLSDFLPYLVLVGGWVPYIYAKYIWHDVPNVAVTTSDIDFGVGIKKYEGNESIASRVKVKKEGRNVINNINRYFKDADSKGPIFIEQENGPDDFITNVRDDAYNRIKQLLM